MVVAPAGSGKSILLSQWAGSRRTAWLSLTPAHDDAAELAADLVTALEPGGGSPLGDRAAVAASEGGRLGADFLAWVRQVLESPNGPDLLVLDDLHALTNASVLRDLEELVLDPPGNCAVAIGSRWDPPFTLSQLRLSGRLVELRAADLAFDELEAHAMVEQVAGRKIDGELTSSLVALTEDWAAGLQLAALSMQRQDPEPFVKGFAGDDRLIVEYLTTEVLDSQPATLRRFLLLTSVLEWMTPALCDAVTGDGDGREMLRTLVDRNLFVSSVEASTGRVRYHHLFADLLRYQLAAERPGVAERSRLRAADWLLAHGEVRAAIDQLVAAGEHARAFDAIVQHGLSFFERGETATLVRWLDTVHRSGVVAEPMVSITLLAAQIGAEEFVAAGETCRRLANGLEVTPGEQVAVDALCSLGGLGDLPTDEVRRRAAAALEGLASIDRSSVPGFFGLDGADTSELLASFSSGVAELYDGALDDAADRLQRAMNLAGARYPIWFINCAGALGLVHALAGRLGEAQRFGTMSLDAAADVGADHHVAVSLAHLALAVVGLDQLDPEAAGLHLDAAGSIVRRCRRPAYHQFLEMFEARRLALTAGPDEAIGFLRTHRPLGTHRRVLDQARLALEVELLLAVDAPSDAASLLAEASTPSPASSIDMLLRTQDHQGARRALDDWRPADPTPRVAMERELRVAALHRLEGHTGAAVTALEPALLRAQLDGLSAPLLAVPLVVELLRSAPPSREVDPILRFASQRRNRSEANSGLIEPLTERELNVLELMPSRLSSAEIAEALYVSVNTLKTHRRNIYRKLDVTDRDGAVRAAYRLGLLSGDGHS